MITALVRPRSACPWSRNPEEPWYGLKTRRSSEYAALSPPIWKTHNKVCPLEFRNCADLQVLDTSFSWDGPKASSKLHSTDLSLRDAIPNDMRTPRIAVRNKCTRTGQFPDKILPFKGGLDLSHSISFLVLRFPGGWRIGGYWPTSLGRFPSLMACDFSVSKRHRPHTKGT